jgi:hypothetical protein
MVHAEAMTAAAAAYRAWHEKNQRERYRLPDRRAFIALRKAARALDAALQPFTSGGITPEGQRLLAHLQALHAPRPQHDYRQMIEALTEPLLALSTACERELGPSLGQHRPRDHDADIFVFIAADTWRKRGHGKPAASERSPFWRALHSAVKADAGLPRLTRGQVVDALARWPDEVGDSPTSSQVTDSATFPPPMTESEVAEAAARWPVNRGR